MCVRAFSLHKHSLYLFPPPTCVHFRMMAVDAQLAAVFRQHVGKRTNKKQLQRENQRFRLRVLDLAEIYMRKRSTSPSIIYFIPALLKVSGERTLRLGDAFAAASHRTMTVYWC